VQPPNGPRIGLYPLLFTFFQGRTGETGSHRTAHTARQSGLWEPFVSVTQSFNTSSSMGRLTHGHENSLHLPRRHAAAEAAEAAAPEATEAATAAPRRIAHAVALRGDGPSRRGHR